MRDYLEIVPFGESDLDFAASCTAAEGWITETREEFESFLEYDRKGCLVARQSGEPVGICVATSYVEWGFIGELVVLPEHRGKGIGRRLLDHAIAYLRARGASSVCLDGVVSALELYKRAGFRRVCRSLRFTGEIEGKVFPGVRAMQTEDMGACLALDAAAFGADRASFLQRRQALHPESCRVLEIDGQIRGFIMARATQNGLVIGPWVVHSAVPSPERLLRAFALGGDSHRVSLGVLGENPRAVSLVRSLGLQELPDPPWRMLLGGPLPPVETTWTFAIGSPAKG